MPWLPPSTAFLEGRMTTDEWKVVTRNLKVGETTDSLAADCAASVIAQIHTACGTLGRTRGPDDTIPSDLKRQFEGLLMWDFCGRLGPGSKVLQTEAREKDMSAAVEWLKWVARTEGSIAAPDTAGPADVQGATSPVANLGGKHRRASARQTQGAI